MPAFTLNEPIETDEPLIEVEALPRVGRYTFELVVVDRRGERSAPVQATVTVRRAIVPPSRDAQDVPAPDKSRRGRKPKAEAQAETPAEKPQRKSRKKPPAAKPGDAAP
jgi:hypothetical protein